MWLKATRYSHFGSPLKGLIFSEFEGKVFSAFSALTGFCLAGCFNTQRKKELSLNPILMIVSAPEPMWRGDLGVRFYSLLKN
jgi:hypothetical protein